MKNLEMIQKLSVLQCIYQVIVSSDGSIVGSRDDAAIDYAMKELSLTSNFAWNSAIVFSPFEAFKHVSIMDYSAKIKFKFILLNIAEMGGNRSNRRDIAKQIFQRTNC